MPKNKTVISTQVEIIKRMKDLMDNVHAEELEMNGPDLCITVEPDRSQSGNREPAMCSEWKFANLMASIPGHPQVSLVTGPRPHGRLLFMVDSNTDNLEYAELTEEEQKVVDDYCQHSGLLLQYLNALQDTGLHPDEMGSREQNFETVREREAETACGRSIVDSVLRMDLLLAQVIGLSEALQTSLHVEMLTGGDSEESKDIQSIGVTYSDLEQMARALCQINRNIDTDADAE